MSIWSRLVFEEETLGIPGVHSLGQYNYIAAKAGLPPHQHVNCVEISLLVKGFQTYQVGGKTYHIRGGEQYVSLPGEIHDTGSQPEDKGILYWLILDVSRVRDQFLFLAPAVARKLISDLLRLPTRHFTSAPDAHATLDRAFNSSLQVRRPDESTGIFKHRGPANDRKPRKTALDDSHHLLTAANQMVYFLLQTIAASKANIRPISAVIQRSLDFIAKNEETWLNVGQLAEELRLSESQFKFLFREEVGLPPAEYMLRRKIEAAKLSLGKPGCNITDLAYRLGFSSSQYFATAFKRYTNETPSQYMQRVYRLTA